MRRTARRNPSPNRKLRESWQCAAVLRLLARRRSTHNNHSSALRAHRKHTMAVDQDNRWSEQAVGASDGLSRWP